MSARAAGWGRRAAAAAPAAAAALALGGWLLGSFLGCTNDAFDPLSIPNQRPVARVFVSTAPGDTLNPTSYWRRTFHWSGSDADGFVVAYHVSIRTGVEPAAWLTTTKTDTTMTFTTDDEGHAEATIMIACRDDRGADSDTVVQYVPLRNFPPVINFAADFDTVRWSYGSASFRLFALDLDGNETMSPTWRYRLDTADTNLVFAPGDPLADPAAGWVTRSWPAGGERSLEIELRRLPPGPARTLVVGVGDEARSEGRFEWTWEVKPAVGPVLVVADVSLEVEPLYAEAMDSVLGPGGWSAYPMRRGLPDRDWVLLETFRQFPVVFWYGGTAATAHLTRCEPTLRAYLQPTDGAAPGRLLFLSGAATGTTSGLSQGFLEGVLGVSRTASTGTTFYIRAGLRALGQGGLPDIASAGSYAPGIGLTPLTGTEVLWKMEYCRGCYSQREPFDPVVGVRRPARAVAASARAVTIALGLNYFDPAQVRAALAAALRNEMGVAPR